MKNATIKVLFSILLVAALAIGGTFAYLYATDTPVFNTFALADIHTEIDEPTSGTAAEKDPQVVNVGKSAVYVRARAVISGGDAQVLEQNNWITVVYNTEDGNWVYGNDGFYYYAGVLLPKSEEESENPSTPPLFTDVIVSTEVSKEAEFSVDVYQESVLAPTDSEWSLQAAKTAFEEKG